MQFGCFKSLNILVSVSIISILPSTKYLMKASLQQLRYQIINRQKNGNLRIQRYLQIITLVLKGKLVAHMINPIDPHKNQVHYLVTIPEHSVSIFLKSAEEKNVGSLHISFVIGLHSAHVNRKLQILSPLIFYFHFPSREMFTRR